VPWTSTLSRQQQFLLALYSLSPVSTTATLKPKAAYASLKQFTLVSGGATSGASVVSPTIYLSGPRQNVCSSTGAVLAATAFDAQVMTFVGAASTTYVQQLMYAPEAYQFVTADLPLME